MRAFSIVSGRRDAIVGDMPPARERGAVQEIMQADPACVRRASPIDEVTHLLVDHHAGAVPVIDGAGRPVGIVTTSDLLRARIAGTAADIVGEVMTDNVLALPITASLAVAAALISYEGVKLLIVTDLQGKVVGTVSAIDIARWCARGAGYLVDH